MSVTLLIGNRALTELVQSSSEKIRDKVEMERKRIYCLRRSAVSESDYVIEALSLRICLAPQS
jgi:hypothetical protein